MGRIPFSLCPIPSVHQILQGKFVKVLVLPKRLDDIPTEAVYVYPATLGPLRLWFIKELGQGIVGQSSCR